MPTRDSITAIFAKRPRPGEVKTRLCPPLGPSEAAEFALAMLDDTVARHREHAAYGLQLVAAPVEELEWFQERYGPGVAVHGQRGACLGPRMAAWFEEAFSEPETGRPTRVIVGSDSPLLSSLDVARAHAVLREEADLVLVPDAGGGYSLVGLARPAPQLFTRIEMSTPVMFDHTVALAGELGLRTVRLEARGDVDEFADLERLAQDLSRLSPGSPDFPQRTSDWIAAWHATAQAPQPPSIDRTEPT